MSIRTFIFCDACNPQAIRTINDTDSYGRRTCDERSWFEGHVSEAGKIGWVITHDGYNVCPKCHNKGLVRTLKRIAPNTKDSSTTRLMSV